MKRFPVGLTVATAISLTILIGLGGWQLKRLAWKRDVLANVEMLKTATPRRLATVLADARAGRDVEWTRVEGACLPPGPGDRQALFYGLRNGQIVWRAVAPCRLSNAAFDLIGIDRGFDESTVGVLNPKSARHPPVGRFVGVLRTYEKESSFETTLPTPGHVDGGYRWGDHRKIGFLMLTPAGSGSMPPVFLMAERETPAPPGLTPSAVPPDIPNRHLEYALTWFGLAGALAAVYAALVRRRMKA